MSTIHQTPEKYIMNMQSHKTSESSFKRLIDHIHMELPTLNDTSVENGPLDPEVLIHTGANGT